MLLNHPELQFLPENVRVEVVRNLQLNDRAHQEEHVKAVVDFAVELAQLANLSTHDTKKLLTAAFMHDIACHIDRKDHHLIGAKMAVKMLRGEMIGFNIFDLQHVQMMIEQHRASFVGERTLMISELMRLADMGKLDSERFGLRALYHRYESMEREECIKVAAEHLVEKFSPTGYAWDSYPRIGHKLFAAEIVKIKALCSEVEPLIVYLNECYDYILERETVKAV